MIKNISLYGELIKMEFIKMLVYRASYVTGVFNYTIQIGAYFFIWTAIYENRSTLGGMSKEQMITYVVVAWIARAFYFSNLDRIISREIREGQLALELIRPYNYQKVKMARAFGEALFRLLFFTLPSGILIYILYPFGLPQNLPTLGLFLLSIFGSFFINTQVNLLAGMLAFFTQSTSGILRAKRVVVDLLSGLLLPINFYPEWAQDFIRYLPFQAISYLPNKIYLGQIQGWEAAQVLLIQALWVIFLYGAGQLLWRVAVRHVVIHGG